MLSGAASAPNNPADSDGCYRATDLPTMGSVGLPAFKF
jgi:hypothetical protein